MRRRKRSSEQLASGPRTLVILSTPRSGTHLLAHELAASGQVGLAEEFFHDQLLPDFGDRFSVDHTNLAAYLEAFHSQTAAPTGVASVVVFPDHINKLATAGALQATGPAGFAELLTRLPEPAVVLLERQSLLDQTVSFNRATQSWVWTRAKGEDAPPHPAYDFESLTAHLLRLVTIREWTLAAARLAAEHVLVRTTYEALVADKGAVVDQVGKALGLRLEPASDAPSTRPVRAADDESSQRVDALSQDIATLTGALRWAPGNGTTDTVAAGVVTVADRQLAALAESVESQRASAFRRRPVVEAAPNGGPLLAIRSALAGSQNPSVSHVTVLSHGIDDWALQRLYGSGTQSARVSVVHTWASLTAATDVVHINSHTLGWGLANFSAKQAMIAQARATIHGLVQRQIPIMWSINEPITPGTRHINLESEFRAELAAAATVIHATDARLATQASRLFALDHDRVVIGALPPRGDVADFSPISIRPHADDSRVLLVAGSLGQYPQLNHLRGLVTELASNSDRRCTLVVAGSAEGSGSISNDLRALEDAGAIVIESELDAAAHESLVTQSDAVLAPCASEAWFVPIQQLAAERQTPVLATECPGLTSAQGVVWAEPAQAAATLTEFMSQSETAAPEAGFTIDFDDLLRACER